MAGDDDTPGTDLVTTEGGFLPVPAGGDFPVFDPQAALDSDYPIAAHLVIDLMASLDESDEREIAEGFDALPAGAQRTIAEFLDVAGGGKTPAASEIELADFARTEAGRMLTAEWRGKSARNLGKAQFRIDLMLDNMGTAEADRTERWFRGLSANQKAAVLRMLAG